jgi:hypothetical protein
VRAASAVRPLALAGALALAAAGAAPAWLAEGHRRIAVGALGLLPESVPTFFRGGGSTVGHAAIDPDVFRARDVPALADQEAPDHFVDLELLDGEPLAERRWAQVERLAGNGRAASRIGLLPYAVAEGAERLALCFAEHRRWPAEPAIEAKCLLHAGWLAHYAADLEQPLHTTIHHDGWALPGGESPFTGIHRQIDALVGETAFDSAAALDGLELRAPQDLWPAIVGELAASHARLDGVYALEPFLADPTQPRTGAFACAHYRTAARFVAELYLWAWERSATIELPAWLER